MHQLMLRFHIEYQALVFSLNFWLPFTKKKYLTYLEVLQYNVLTMIIHYKMNQEYYNKFEERASSLGLRSPGYELS